MIEKEVEAVLRKSHSEQFAWMESKPVFDLTLRKDLPVWSVFLEATERRNLFVHTDGVVSSQYIKVCAEHGVKLDPSIEVGSKLEMPHEYFKGAFRAVYEIAVKLTHVLWRKLREDQREESDRNLNEICYELIVDEQCDLAKCLLDFSHTTIKKYHSAEYRRMFLINRAQAYKWSGDDNSAKQILASEDWSDSADRFRLAVAVLRDEYEEAVKIMKRIGGADEDLPARYYREWPLFKGIRQTELFRTAYEEIMGEPFKELSLDLPPSE